MDADFLATGHYARVRGHQGRFQLLKGIDASKDQSYALHVLGQEQLSRALFPVGEYGKEEVRGLASTFDLPVAFKGESQDLCFLSDGDYRRFLREREASTASPGPILDQSGAKLGQHEGLPFYTIGQRKGLGISAATPLFVLRKEVERNALVVGPREQLGRRALVAQELNWISGSPPKESARVQVKIRAHAKPVWATVSVHGRERIRVDFDEPVQGVTPGQSAVLYDGEICLGGGVISL
jgi:tRNA-specific 2-thiouridylase